MHTFPSLESLGQRIVIMGPTNAGKSTLAVAIARKLGVSAIHLDQFRHLPDTDWQVRPDAEFHALHDAAILEDGWVMEGNYSVLMPQRFARATGVIVIDDHYLRRFARYFRRTLFEKQRAGNLPGNRDSLKWEMVRWIWKTRRSVSRYHGFAQATGLPQVFCPSLSEVQALGRSWNL
ncbi:hypothetical protein GCM10007913_12840 [Devosia yakushimensis]|uniref:AAA family ATPase n=1 Tax=Devosia yakushimensis TaxID=470028 RepID=A0ABQ5UB58_9HYPH|nr:AAA family ATPase [Devosia yakushimensis]GLQ09352.1 hypothetical protein GCM10007913_12840 [Devosia yakushimensis]